MKRISRSFQEEQRRNRVFHELPSGATFKLSSVVLSLGNGTTIDCETRLAIELEWHAEFIRTSNSGHEQLLEKMLSISPILAQTLGLEEALLVQLLLEMQLMQGQAQVTFSEQHRQQFLPFWSVSQFGLVLKRLSAQGVIEVQNQNPWLIRCELPDADNAQPLANNEPKTTVTYQPPPPPEAEPIPVYAMNDARKRNQFDDDLAYLKPSSQTSKQRARKTRMHTDWEPTEDFPQLLSFHDIPLQFALSELAKFRQYYAATDRTEISWDVRFLNWVQRAWHDSLNSKGRHDRQTATNGEPADASRTKRSKVRDALRNIQDTDW